MLDLSSHETLPRSLLSGSTDSFEKFLIENADTQTFHVAFKMTIGLHVNF